MVIDQASYTSHLPGSILAVFFIAGAHDCRSSNHWVRSRDRCEAYARRAHAGILSHFGLAASDLPLMRLDLHDWQTPFRCVLC